jgi:hypothetical protein
MLYQIGIIVVLIMASLSFAFTTTEQAMAFLLLAIFGQLCVIEDVLKRRKDE